MARALAAPIAGGHEGAGGPSCGACFFVHPSASGSSKPLGAQHRRRENNADFEVWAWQQTPDAMGELHLTFDRDDVDGSVGISGARPSEPPAPPAVCLLGMPKAGRTVLIFSWPLLWGRAFLSSTPSSSFALFRLPQGGRHSTQAITGSSLDSPIPVRRRNGSPPPSQTQPEPMAEWRLRGLGAV